MKLCAILARWLGSETWLSERPAFGLPNCASDSPAMARIFSQTSDQLSTVEEKDDHYVYTIHRCPVCWDGEQINRPVFIATGLLQSGLKWLSGR